MQEIISNFMTDDMEATLDFYCNVLGFKVTNSVPDNEPYSWVSLGKDKGNIMFQTRESLGEDLGLWQEAEIGATMNLYIIVEDIHAIHNRVKDRTEIILEPRKTFYGMEEITIRDNNGYVLTFGSQA